MAHEAGDLNDIRAVLGNDIAIEAYRDGKLPFPEGAIVGRIAWSHVSSEENNRTLFDKDGEPTDEAVMKKCFPCHQAIEDRDFIFTKYAR